MLPAARKPMPVTTPAAILETSAEEPKFSATEREIIVNMAAPMQMRMCVLKPAGLECISLSTPISPPSTALMTSLSMKSHSRTKGQTPALIWKKGLINIIKRALLKTSAFRNPGNFFKALRFLKSAHFFRLVGKKPDCLCFHPAKVSVNAVFFAQFKVFQKSLLPWQGVCATQNFGKNAWVPHCRCSNHYRITTGFFKHPFKARLV